MTQGGGTFLLWADLSPEDLARLDGAVDEAATKAVLADVLRVLDGENPLRAQVLLEFYANNLAFARERGFSAEKTSTFFSIMKRNHDEMVEAFLPQQKSWEYLQALVLGAWRSRRPGAVAFLERHAVCSRRSLAEGRWHTLLAAAVREAQPKGSTVFLL